MDMFDTKKIEKYLKKNFTGYCEHLLHMVEINSHSLNAKGLNRLSAYTSRLFKDLGFKAEKIPAENSPGAHHLFLSQKGAGPVSICYVSHLDTVFTEWEEKENNFKWKVKQGRAYGPGTSDIKGGTLMIYMVLDVLRQFNPELFSQVTWKIFLDATEETCSDDFGRLCLERMDDHTRACLIFEAGNIKGNSCYVVSRRKGRAVFTVEVLGRSSHAGSQHDKGVNAIVHLGQVIQDLASLTDYEQGVSVNVGIVQGGTALNRVPDHARADVEVRADNTEAFDRTVKKVLAWNKRKGRARVKVTLVHRVPAWSANGPTDELCRIWKKAGRELGMNVKTESRGGLSDGNWVWQTVPTIDGLGPAGGGEHTTGEYVDLTSIIPRILLNCRAISILLQEY